MYWLKSSPGNRLLFEGKDCIPAGFNKLYPFVQIELAKLCLKAEVWTKMVSRFFALSLTCWDQLGAGAKSALGHRARAER